MVSDARASPTGSGGAPPAGLEPGLETFAAVFRQATVGMAIGTFDGALREVNPAYCRMLGYDRDELLEMGFQAIAHPADQRIDRERATLLEAGQIDSYQREKRYVRKDGSVLWGLVTVSALRDDTGRFLGALSQLQDVSAQKEAELALRKHEAQLESLVTQLPVAMYTLEPGELTEFRYISPQFEQLTGLRLDTIPVDFEALIEYMHPDDRDAVREANERADVTGEPMHIEYRIRGGDGEWLWVDNRSVLVRDERGHRVAWHGALIDVSERKRLEASLRESEERFRRAFADAAIGMAIGSPDDIVLDANPAYCRIVGRARANLIGHSFAEFTHPDDRDAARQRHARLLAGEIDSYEAEKRYLRPDGTVVPGLLTISAVRDADGVMLYTVGQLQDITAQKAAEDALRQSQAHLRTIVEQVPVAVYRLEPGANSHFTYTSPHFTALTGLSLDRHDGSLEAFFARIHPEDVAVVRSADLLAGQTGQPLDLEYRMRGRDGAWFWVHDSSRLTRDEAGNPESWHGFLLDISERKRLEASLRESEERFRRAFEDAAIGMSLGDSRHVCLDANPAYCRIVGRPRDAVVSHPFAEITHPDDVETYLHQHARLYAGEIDSYQLEKRYVRPDESLVTGLLTVSAVRDAAGSLLYDIGQLQDITAQKAAEAALRESEERFRSAFEGAGIGMALIDPRGPVLDANLALCQFLGYTRDELLLESLLEMTHPDDLPVSLAEARSITEGDVDAYHLEKRYIRRDGRTVWAHVTANALRNSDGQLRYVIAQIQDITARKEAEAALIQSEARFRSMFERTGIGTMMFTPEWTILVANPALGQILDYDPEELAGLHIDDISFPVAPDQLHENRRRMWAGEIDAYQIEKFYRRKDGSLMWALVNVSAIRDEAGRLTASIGQIQDVTARKEAETALRESEKLFRSTFEGAGIGIALSGPDGRIQLANPALERFLGYTSAELSAMTVDDITYPADLPNQKMTRDRANIGELDTYQLEKRYVHKSGEVVWGLLDASVVRDEQGATRYVIGQVQDITARKEAEAALRESEESFRSVFEGAAIGMARTTPDGTIVMANPALERLLDYAPGELTGVRIDDVSFPDDLPMQADLRQRLRDGDIEGYRFEKRFVRKDGEIVWGLLNATSIRDGRGVVQAVIGQVQDISARKEAEAALLESEARFRALVQNDPDIIIVIDDARHVTYASPAVVDLVGFPAEELHGSIEPNLHWLHPKDREKTLALFDQVGRRPGATAFTEARIKHHRLGWRWFHVTMTNLFQVPGVGGFLVNLRDVTELKRAELATKAALTTQQKAVAELERLNQSKSQFLSTISHEFRTPLTAIIGFSELLAATSSDTATIVEDAAVIHREASRLNRMVNDILLVDRLDAGQLPLSLEPVDLNAIVRDVVRTFRPLAEKHRFALELDPSLWRVNGDGDRLAQAVTNLVSNAVKYSPAGGIVTIVTRNHGEGVLVSIRDEGIGIAPRDFQRIFDRFERAETKTAGRIGGTGLGLAIVRELASLHGGRVWAENNSGPGTTFYLELPALQFAPAVQSAGWREP